MTTEITITIAKSPNGWSVSARLGRRVESIVLASDVSRKEAEAAAEAARVTLAVGWDMLALNQGYRPSVDVVRA